MKVLFLLLLFSCTRIYAQEDFVNADSAETECSLPTDIAAVLQNTMGCFDLSSAPYVCAPNVSVHSTMVGGGCANVLDTYLSPYNYTGPEVRIIRETMRMTKLSNGKISNQTLIDINASYLDNRAGTAHEWAGGIRYSMGWHYNFRRVGNFLFLGGLMASGYVGAVYNTRNGNNPAQAKADVCLDLSGMAIYDFRIRNKRCRVRYELNIPFIGAAFSPQYGQSYYEIFSLGHYDHNAVFAYFGNMPSMRHLLSLDIPLGRNTLRIGYAGEFNQSTFNNLRYHSYSHDIMIGFSKSFYRK